MSQHPKQRSGGWVQVSGPEESEQSTIVTLENGDVRRLKVRQPHVLTTGQHLKVPPGFLRECYHCDEELTDDEPVIMLDCADGLVPTCVLCALRRTRDVWLVPIQKKEIEEFALTLMRLKAHLDRDP